MKRLAITLAVLLTSAVASQAILRIAWTDPTGFVMSDGTTPIIDGSTGPEALVQLIYSLSGSIAPAVVGGLASGDNVILAEAVHDATDPGNPYLGTFAHIYEGTYLPGFVFVRVFQGGTGIGLAAVGDYYGDGQVLATINNAGGAQPPDFVEYGPLQGGTGDFGTWRLENQVVVPEPTTLALAALGVLGVVARRFRRS